MPTVGVVPYVVCSDNVATATDRLNLPEFFAMAQKSFGAPPGRERYEDVADLDGGAIVGPPAAIVDEVMAYLEMGVEHFVFDLRVQFDEWESVTETIGESVLPALKTSTRKQA